MENVEYRGWKHNVRISNGDAEVIATLDIGPRIISYKLTGRENVFKNYDDQMGGSGEAEWMIRGGHRLWVGPEDHTRTYALDNAPVHCEQIAPLQIRLRPDPDTTYGIQKEIDLTLAPKGSKATVVHRLTNIGKTATDLAPWTISVMAQGGFEVIPLPAKRPHPGSPKNAKSAEDFAANQLMTIWPYFDFEDPRWKFASRYIKLAQDPNKGPTKIGLAHKLGWVAYVNKGGIFVKKFTFEEGKAYPDQGVNFETFTYPHMLEIETLGPLVKLAPGATVEHVERWEIAPEADATPERVIDEIVPRLG